MLAKEKKTWPNPFAENFARLVRHPKSDHPDRLGRRGCRQMLKNINNAVEKKYKGQTRNKVSVTTMYDWLSGKRKPTVDSAIKFCEAYEELFGKNVNPWDLFVDRTRWIYHAELPEELKEICDMIKNLRDERDLKTIKDLALSLSGK